MTTDTNGQQKWNLGDLLHLVHIAVLLGTMGMAYEKFQVVSEQVAGQAEQINRVEHYLSSKDADYWHRSKD